MPIVVMPALATLVRSTAASHFPYKPSTHVVATRRRRDPAPLPSNTGNQRVGSNTSTRRATPSFPIVNLAKSRVATSGTASPPVSMRHRRHHPKIPRRKSSGTTRLIRCIINIHSYPPSVRLCAALSLRVVVTHGPLCFIKRERDNESSQHAHNHFLAVGRTEILPLMDMGDKSGGIKAEFPSFFAEAPPNSGNSVECASGDGTRPIKAV
jgi:hypothetical protein